MQFMLIVGAAILMIIFTGMHKGLSFAAGSVSYWLPVSLFMNRTSKYAGASAVSKFLFAFLTGEIIKLSLCGILFVVAVKVFSLSLGYTLAGFIGAIFAFCIASFGVLFHSKARI